MFKRLRVHLPMVGQVFAYILFWSWNAIFLAFMFFGFAPTLLPEILKGIQSNVVPVEFLVYAVILTLIPVAAVVLGLTVLRRSPGRLLALGYGVEGPVMLLVALRFFVVREATPAMVLLLVIAGVGQAALLWQILDRNIDARRIPLGILRVMGLTCLLIVGLYTSVWLAFYVAPVAAAVWTMVVDLLRYGPLNLLADLTKEGIVWLPFFVLGSVLLIYSATLFVAMPVAVSFLYVRAWWRGVRAFAAGHGRLLAGVLPAATLAVCVVLMAFALQQPQHRAFALLEEPPASPEEAQALLDRQGEIRAGLLNAYLSPFRYVSAVGEVFHVRDMYYWVVGLSPRQAAWVQAAYEVVARPLLYEPVHPPEITESNRWDNLALRQEPLEAAELYEQFFDQTIIEGERETVVRTVRTTWSMDQALAAWQAVDDREVLLLRQEVTVAEYGDWAEVELYEVYQNQTGQRQEVVYYFSLPESAVVTGVWLGNSPDRDARFAYRVAPRGAAQAVYRNEVRRNLDPALVEQIGPRQYRLRAFPIEPVRWFWGETGVSTTEEGPPLHLWLTYQVLASDGTWPMPRLAEKRSVYWDSSTVRLVNGEAMQADDETWLPDSVAATGPAEPAIHRVDFPGGETVVVHPVLPSDLPELPAGLRLAVVLDRSRSMAIHGDEVVAALARLDGLPGSEVDVYLTASPYRGEGPSLVRLADFDSTSVMYYGGQNAADLLIQFDALCTGQVYDGILVLTDGTGYELGGGDVEVPVPEAPVWMVHLGGEFPLGYDDATLEAIQASGGGVVGSVDEALTRLTVALEAGETAGGSAAYDVIDGYVWWTGSSDAVEGGAVTDGGFAAIAARRVILAEMQRNRGALDELDVLDRMHAIAIEYSVVTPYSSMIVLVEERQERLLKQLEARGDRFEREHEEVGETASETALGVTAVPEPEEWLLIALVVAMLAVYLYKKRPFLRHWRMGSPT